MIRFYSIPEFYPGTELESQIGVSQPYPVELTEEVMETLKTGYYWIKRKLSLPVTEFEIVYLNDEHNFFVYGDSKTIGREDIALIYTKRINIGDL